MTDPAKAQAKCASLLPDLIRKGEAELLPPLVWVVGFDGMTGKLDTFGGRSKARKDFAAWAMLLDASVRPARKLTDGRVLLVASRRFKDAVVVLRCELDPDLSSPQEENR